MANEKREGIFAALEDILDHATDEQISALDKALREYEIAYPNFTVRILGPLCRGIIDTLYDECGYRSLCRDCDGSGLTDYGRHACPTCKGTGRVA